MNPRARRTAVFLACATGSALIAIFVAATATGRVVFALVTVFWLLLAWRGDRMGSGKVANPYQAPPAVPARGWVGRSLSRLDDIVLRRVETSKFLHAGEPIGGWLERAPTQSSEVLGRIVVGRVHAQRARGLPFRVVVDREHRADLHDGEWIELQLPEGPHTVWFQLEYTGSLEIPVVLTAAHTVAVTCRAPQVFEDPLTLLARSFRRRPWIDVSVDPEAERWIDDSVMRPVDLSASSEGL